MKKLSLVIVLISALFTSVFANPAGGSGYTEPAEGTYNLRDTGPAGGIIFYINPDADQYGWKYLEVAPTSGIDAWDQSMNYEWCDADDFFYTKTSVEIGTGKSNTAMLMADVKNNYPIAQACSNYSGGGYNDWFVPSRDELLLVYENLHAQSPAFGGFTETRYWSSSEIEEDQERAIPIYFSDGEAGARGKPVSLPILPCRAF